MKNIILALILFIGFGACVSVAGECSNGYCQATVLRPVRKVVNVTKEIVVAPVRAVVTFATPNTCCTDTTTSSYDCGCSSSNKTVTKYQPLRRRLVNRSTSVSCCN